MNKHGLVNAIAEKTKLSKVDIEKTLNAFTQIIQSEVKEGSSVTLMGFGTFTSSLRKARNGYDPYRKKEISIPNIKLPIFRAGKDFKKKLNTTR